jgi:transposase
MVKKREKLFENNSTIEQKIINDYLSGKSINYISKIYKCSWNVVNRIIKDAINNNLIIYKKIRGGAQSKLTEHDVYQILIEYNSTEISQEKLAKKYNIERSTVRNIVNGKTWKDIYLKYVSATKTT